MDESETEAKFQDREFFRHLVENTLDIITVIGSDGSVVYNSPALERELGYAPEDLNNKPVADFIHPDDQARIGEVIGGILTGVIESEQAEFRFRHCDGSYRYLQAVARHWQINGEPALLVNSRDITDVLEVEENLRQAQKMEAVGQLTGGVAHDFNNLVSIVQGNAELLRMHAKSQSILVEYTNNIIEASNRAANLTEQLLAFSRRQQLLPVPLHLGDTLEAFEPLLKTSTTKEISADIECADDLWLCLVDQTQFENAALNLTLNAKDAMPKGGVIRYQIANESLTMEDHANLLIDAPDGDYVRLSVTDSGAGMTQEIIEKAFEPFFTTKDVGKGTGMGLSMVFGFVKQSGGLIDISSSLESGTTVSIYFPRFMNGST